MTEERAPVVAADAAATFEQIQKLEIRQGFDVYILTGFHETWPRPRTFIAQWRPGFLTDAEIFQGQVNDLVEACGFPASELTVLFWSKICGSAVS